MDLGLVRKIDIDTEMQQAYLDYAMSVIVARALPDARDGLKPVQRRILYAMYDMGLRADSTYKKSARIVGEVLGKYHPHGDSAVYEAMARMAQDFSLRTLLVDGQGNFGSIDGDPPAAMRYTEARLARPSINMLADISKDTVDFIGNFDDTLQEPAVLPAAIPNLLVNGATGIAVGMATSIPPHNLSEIVDALVYMLHNWEKLDDISVEDLMQFVQGPDFPTGGLIIEGKGEEGIESAYGSGRGRVTIQAKAHIESMERGRSRIIVTELPYQVNKSSLIERIAELARDGTLEGLADLRDESDRQGMRIVIEMGKNADSDQVLGTLYKRTPMQGTFSINLLALVDGEPRTLTLKQSLRVYLDHRLTVIKRRADFDLEKARQRAHILEGYLTALKHLDEIVNIIRAAADADTASQKLMKRYKFTEVQAEAILDLQLRRLAALERKKIEAEFKEVTALIKSLESLLRSARRMREVVADELLAVKEAFGDRRRTQIVSLSSSRTKKPLTTAEVTSEQAVWVGITMDGHMARTRDDKQPKGGGMDAPRFLVRLNTSDVMYLVAASGQAAAVSINNIPAVDKLSAGPLYYKVSPLSDAEPPAAVFSIPSRRADLPEETALLTVTRSGMVKKTLVSDLPGPSAQTFTLVRLNEGDALTSVGLTDGKKDILLVTASGMAIRFRETEVRPMGLVAAGVNGIRLEEKDEVIGAEVLPIEGELFFLTSNGTAKRVNQKEFPQQGRYGKGVRAWLLPKRVKIAGLASGKDKWTVTLHTSKSAPRAHRMEAAPLRKRTASRGSQLVDLKPGEIITAVTNGWTLDRFIKIEKQEPPVRVAKSSRKKTATTTKKKTPVKKTGGGKKSGHTQVTRLPKKRKPKKASGTK
jgi:DNA gyrase subunit A